MQTLSYRQFMSLLEGSQIILAGKVFRLAGNGHILKFFRIKKLFSSGRLWPYAARFRRNAEKLARRGIPTVTVVATYRIPDLGQTAARYEELPGHPLEEELEEGEFTAERIQQLAIFFARLHACGVYFRSIHFGNILVTKQNDLGLIDIVDMKVHARPLGFAKRLRNFNHLFRNDSDRKSIRPVIHLFLAAYQESSGLTPSRMARIRRHVLPLLDQPGQT
jgi:hypothetical protein